MYLHLYRRYNDNKIFDIDRRTYVLLIAKILEKNMFD
jgi:hypothetical protein